MFSKSGLNEINSQANLGEYESDGHDQTLLQSFAFRNSIVPSILFIISIIIYY